jgi:hypothetical protein
VTGNFHGKRPIKAKYGKILLGSSVYKLLAKNLKWIELALIGAQCWILILTTINIRLS